MYKFLEKIGEFVLGCGESEIKVIFTHVLFGSVAGIKLYHIYKVSARLKMFTDFIFDYLYSQKSKSSISKTKTHIRLLNDFHEYLQIYNE